MCGGNSLYVSYVSVIIKTVLFSDDRNLIRLTTTFVLKAKDLKHKEKNQTFG